MYSGSERGFLEWGMFDGTEEMLEGWVKVCLKDSIQDEIEDAETFESTVLVSRWQIVSTNCQCIDHLLVNKKHI